MSVAIIKDDGRILGNPNGMGVAGETSRHPVILSLMGAKRACRTSTAVKRIESWSSFERDRSRLTDDEGRWVALLDVEQLLGDEDGNFSWPPWRKLVELLVRQQEPCLIDTLRLTTLAGSLKGDASPAGPKGHQHVSRREDWRSAS